MYGLRQLMALAMLILVASALQADAEMLPADRRIPEVIDHYVDQKLKEAAVTPAPQADDHTLARRLYLDLAGRIPTAAEARAYAESTDPQKREKLVDSLVASVEFVRHNATEFDELLRGENTDAASVRNYLLVAFQENRPWDRMFRELMGVDADPAKPQLFVTKRLKDSDALTRDVSAIFFGLNISCAQCHRHPHVKALTQDYYYGLKAFFAQSYEIQDNLLERQFAAPLSFKTKSGEARTARLQFLNGKTAEPPAVPAMDLNKEIQDESKRIAEFTKNYAKTKELPPALEFSPRRQLVELALAPDGRDLLARAIVNRLWHRFYGYGLVMHVDQMHAKNAPSHPQLLDWLRRDLIAHGYDLRRLIHGLVSSKAYARSSRWESGQPPAPELFAVASVRALTPMQWGVSHRLASNPVHLRGSEAGPQLPRETQLELIEVEARKMFQMIEPPHDGMQIGVGESLKLSNDATLLRLTGDRLVPALLKLPDRKAQIDQAVWTVLSRPATAAEHELLAAYLERRQDRPADAMQQLVWALVNSPEFRFNH
jgi:hypothetical protein